VKDLPKLQHLHEAYWSAVPESVRGAIYLLRVGYPFKALAARLIDTNVRRRTMGLRLSRLHNKYTDRRCFIMGNGPSLNKMDLELFGDEYVWGANKCHLLFDRISWRPAFYTAIDKRVVPDMAVDIGGLVSDLPTTTFFFPAWFRQQWVLRSAENLYWYHEVKLDENNLPDGAFTRDASAWVSTSLTVTVAALQLAVYLGFNPIYLIGCDTSYSVPSTVRFELGNQDSIVSTADDDPNHFDPRYFGKGSKWSDPHVELMIFHYVQAKAVCDSLGVTVFNATVGGNLEIFPRVNYREILS
jgi:hypothetical protein